MPNCFGPVTSSSFSLLTLVTILVVLMIVMMPAFVVNLPVIVGAIFVEMEMAPLMIILMNILLAFCLCQ